MAKSPKKNKKEKPNRAPSPEVIARGCKQCGRWALLARAVYQDSGELCSANSCPNATEEVTPGEDIAVDALDFYEESDALKEKSED